MPRSEGRTAAQTRSIKITKDYMKHAEGSCLIECGETRVICTATVEEQVPLFLRNTGKGWVTAEYGMLPRSCNTRVRRDKTSGRTQEIQRLIGRSLRAVVDQRLVGERTIKIDCDVIHADGGTRTASITGSFVALALALHNLKAQGVIKTWPLTDYVAAISVGIVKDALVLDLDYSEDSNAQMDMNVVMVGQGDFVEVQGTAEGRPFSQKEMEGLLDLAREGIEQWMAVQQQQLEGIFALEGGSSA